MPGKLCKTVRKLAWQMGKTTKQTHQDKFHRNFKDKVLAWKASECCGNLFNVASVHSTHNNRHTQQHAQTHTQTYILTQQNKHTQKAGKVFEKSQAKPMTDATKWKKEEWIFLARPESIRNSCAIFDRRGGEWEGESERGTDCWTFVALVAILSARQILILKVCHGIPFVCPAYAAYTLCGSVCVCVAT